MNDDNQVEALREWVRAAEEENRAAQLRIAELERESRKGRPPSLNMVQVEQWAVQQAMVQARGNKREAAKILGVGKTTLYRRLDEMRVSGVSFYERERPTRDRPTDTLGGVANLPPTDRRAV